MAKSKQTTEKWVSLPARFEPRFWEDADGRCAVIRQIRTRYEDLRADAGADSFQKDILCQRATFLLAYLETMERKAIEDGQFDPGVWSNMTNTLLGVLKALGLERRAKKVDLRQYVEAKS